MNDPRIPNIKSAHHVRKTSPANDPMEGHLSVRRTLELLAADMNAHSELIQPIDTRLVARILSLVGYVDVDLNLPLSAQDE